jgi:hypothetical protein
MGIYDFYCSKARDSFICFEIAAYFFRYIHMPNKSEQGSALRYLVKERKG